MLRACSAHTCILSNWRCISGMSASGVPNATRRRATNPASVTARRISPAARTPLDRRELLTMSAIWRNPAPGSPTSHATAPSSRTSPLAIDRVPSLSFNRTIRAALGRPSGRLRGSRNRLTPRMPSGTPKGRASTIARAASGLLQNHLSPVSAQVPSGSGAAATAVAPTSDPAPCSVMNIAPWARWSMSWLVSAGR